MGSSSEEVYAMFEEKVKRTVYMDNISPKVTKDVLRAALDQFGTVKSVDFIPNYIGLHKLLQCALVEMANQKEASAAISMLSQFPFMLCGKPRPVRARPAEADMFQDRPRKPGVEIRTRWLSPEDPDFEVAKKMKDLVKKHAAESEFLLQKQLEEEEKLARKQKEALEAARKKYEMLDAVIADKTATSLKAIYDENL